MNCFSNGFKTLNLFGRGDHENGLYGNQLGAIGSAIAHFSINTEPALITMPTGTGKTAVMIVLSYIFKCKRVLVITPSQLVRNQIAEQFANAKFLIRNNILQKEFLPRTYELTTVETNKEEWDAILANCDVCVAIPGTLNQILVTNAIATDAFDVIFVDEAHHSRAKSWSQILEYFSKSKQILLTATPFRRDKKDLKAKIVYDFPLKMAYEQGLFSKLKYVPVKRESGMTDDEVNIAIAKKTESTFKSRSYHAHRIIIRTDQKTKADSLFDIYQNNTSLKLVVIHSKLSDKTIKQRIQQLKDGSIDGVICVDMMGEGYDFPLLKFAAIHVPHKSLSITLQFVGRISRTNVTEGNTATIIASEYDLAIESRHLFKEDSDWSIILPDLHRSKIDQTKEEQEFQESFNFLNIEQPPLVPDSTSLDLEVNNILPFFHAKIYRIFGATTLKNENPLPFVDVFRPIPFGRVTALINPVLRSTIESKINNVAVHIVAQLKKPNWLIDSDSISDIVNELIIIYYNEANSLLFICSTVKETDLYELIASSVVVSPAIHEIVFLPHLKRVLAGWESVKFYNVGMKSRKTKGNAESYKQILGSSVQDVIGPSDKYSYTRGHSFGEGFDTVLNKGLLLGISTSSKVWSLDEKKLLYLINWCNEIARKVGDPTMDNLKGPLSDLDTGILLNEFPADKAIFFADWDANIYLKNTKAVFIDVDGVIIEEYVLCSCGLHVESFAKGEVHIRISKGAAVCKIIGKIAPVIEFDYHAESPCKISFKQGLQTKEPEYFLSLLKSDPIHLFFEDMSHLSGKVYFEFNTSMAIFPSSNFLKTKWPANVNTRSEFYTDEMKVTTLDKPMSIHDYILSNAIEDFDAVYYDHASLEIADVLAFKPGLIRFYHCKKQDSDEPRVSVDDMYEVIGQAVKSVNWSNRKLLMAQLITRAEQNKITSKIKKGSTDLIKIILDSFDNPMLPIEIIIVQPGLKTDNHTTGQAAAFQRINILLAGASEYMSAVSKCELKVMCS